MLAGALLNGWLALTLAELGIFSAGLHLAFSAVVGIAFALVLWELSRAGLGGVLGSYAGYVAASIAGGAILYFVMWYLVLPWANTQFKELALKGPFFVAHLFYGRVSCRRGPVPIGTARNPSSSRPGRLRPAGQSRQ